MTSDGTDARLLAWWRFDTESGDVTDFSGNGHTLRPIGNPARAGGTPNGWVMLNGKDQYLETAGPVLRTDESFSVAAWLRLDSTVLGEQFGLPPGWFAFTAVSQPGPVAGSLTHSPFFLGVRALDEYTPEVVKWCLEVAPVDGDPPGPPWPFVWEKAFSADQLDSSVLDQWVFVVGVVDKERLAIHLYLPATDDHGTAALVPHWPFWHADAPVQIGRAYWRENPVDQWPGSIGPVRLYEGTLTREDAHRLYREDLDDGAPS
ncbi:LamG-like jellyroll fold domain-containing protein [Actinomycetes bacterium KLBMP 9797]